MVLVRASEAQALVEHLTKISRSHSPPRQTESHDHFGLDEAYLHRHSQCSFRFLERVYWRITTEGLDHVPKSGGAILVGIHRGFMPFDGVMLVHLFYRYVRRIPRFLLHPTLVKFPGFATFFTKIGSVIASQENADYVLEKQEMLGIFPEGIRGAFRMYRDAYDLTEFGRSDYVKFAINHDVPIVPFVFLGPAEIFPIFKKVKWNWWKRQSEWPFFPITATWPLLPIPLPTKWRLRILPPIKVDSPRKSQDELIDETHEQVRQLIKKNLDEMRAQRRSIF